MIRTEALRIFCLIALCILPAAHAVDVDERRARFNYMMFCQGCHQPDAAGSDKAHVPQIRGFVGHFLKVEEGREFLVRVPGSAYAAVDDEQLAELLNWMILEFSGDSMPHNFLPYTGQEVGQLRDQPLIEVNDTRNRLVERITQLNR